ncbi:MAG: hypothetical protein AAF747_03710 [Planctomycetota bacterium]
MRKPGTNEADVRMSDVLCDFCHREWADDVPMIEGHQGACICGGCLRFAFSALMLERMDMRADKPMCTMCREQRDEAMWQSPMHAEAWVCRRCVKLASGVLHKDADWDWERPTG